MSRQDDQLLIFQIILALLRVANGQGGGEPISEKIKKTRTEIDEEMAKLNN